MVLIPQILYCQELVGRNQTFNGRELVLVEAGAPLGGASFSTRPCAYSMGTLTVHLQEVGLQVRVQAAMGQAVTQVPVQGQDIQQNLQTAKGQKSGLPQRWGFRTLWSFLLVQTPQSLDSLHQECHLSFSTVPEDRQTFDDCPHFTDG